MARDEDIISSEFYDKYTGINKQLLRKVGLWPQGSNENETFFRRALTTFYLFNLVGLTSTQFYHVYIIWENFFDCLEVLCNTTTALLIIHKAVIFLYKKNTILEFEALSKRMWVAEFRDLKNRQTMIEAAQIGQRLTYLFTGIVIFTITNFFAAPAISLFNQWRRGVPKENIVYVLPFLVMFPGDLRNPMDHALAYIPVIICSVCLVYYIVGIDSFYFVWVQHIVLHLKLLQKSLDQISRFQNDYDDKSAADLIRMCIKKHNVIIEHSAVLEEVYGPIILGLCVISTLSMCMVIFHAVVTMGGHNGNMALFLMYFYMEVSEVLLYCWFGNSLMFQSMAVCTAAYNTDWYEDRPDKGAFAKCIQIMMIRTQRPIKLTAYKFADVSLELFTAIMSSTVSYFALLRTLYVN